MIVQRSREGVDACDSSLKFHAYRGQTSVDTTKSECPVSKSAARPMRAVAIHRRRPGMADPLHVRSVAGCRIPDSCTCRGQQFQIPWQTAVAIPDRTAPTVMEESQAVRRGPMSSRTYPHAGDACGRLCISLAAIGLARENSGLRPHLARLRRQALRQSISTTCMPAMALVGGAEDHNAHFPGASQRASIA